MGLQAEVPLCNIKLAAPDSALLHIDSDDLMQLPKTPQVTPSLYSAAAPIHTSATHEFLQLLNACT